MTVRDLMEAWGLLSPRVEPDPKDEFKWIATLTAITENTKGQKIREWYYLLYVNGHDERKCEAMGVPDYCDWEDHPLYTRAILPWLECDLPISSTMLDSFDHRATKHIHDAGKKKTPEPKKEDDPQLAFAF